MKINNEKRKTNTAKRTIDAFSNALLALLQKNSLEQITISMLCEESTYPRSTFYNYFEDIYDLIDCIMEKVSEKIQLGNFKAIDHKVRSLTLFEATYNVLNAHQSMIQNIRKKNDCNSVFMNRVREFMKKKISYIIANSECIKLYKLSSEIMMQHYSNTIMLVLEKCILYSEQMTKEDALRTLDFLIGTLEREASRSNC